MNRRLSPSPTVDLVFGEFRLDRANEQLLRGEEAIHLRPKAWDVLCFLIERPGQLVSRQMLHERVWERAAVSDDTLTQSIGELRRALGDSTRKPRFIETVHRRGFRFIARIVPDRPREEPAAQSGGDPAVQSSDLDRSFVGRAEELEQLRSLFAKAERGTRQLIFVTGEAGIGKTRLVEQFLDESRIHETGGAVLRGQCVQQHGQREPYMPVLEAIERHLASPIGAGWVQSALRLAPHVAALLPTLPAGAIDPVQIRNVSYEGMLREIGCLLESMAATAPLVLVLEDLHWSDPATLDLLSFLAQREDPSRLLLIGTYRPAEAALHSHPVRDLRQNLRLRRRCSDRMLDYLTVSDIAEFLRVRFGNVGVALAPLIHRRTDGNPLFILVLVEDLMRRGWIRAEADGWRVDLPALDHAQVVPDDLREMISQQLDALDPEEKIALEVASVVGVRFDARVVAAALGREVEEVEAISERLVRRHSFLRYSANPSPALFPERYEFGHALRHQVLYDQVPDGRRRRLHRAVAEALESSPGADIHDRAAVLSIHYERCGLYARAVHHLAVCVDRAQQRAAHREAEAYVARALELLTRLPPAGERADQELKLRLRLGRSLNVTHGYTAAEVRDNLLRLQDLCAANGDDDQLFEITVGIWYSQLGADAADHLWGAVDDLEKIAQRRRSPDLRPRVELVRGRSEFWLGNFERSVDILGRFIDSARQGSADDSPSTYGVAPMVAAFMQRGLGLWFLGFPEQARTHIRQGMQRAENTRQPFDLASALSQAALFELLCGDGVEAEALAQRAVAVCNESDVAFFRAVNRSLAAAGRLRQGNPRGVIPEMEESLNEQKSLGGCFLGDLMLALLASASLQGRKWDEGLRFANEGIELSRRSVERIFVAELWRIKGELLVGKSDDRSRRAGKTESGQLSELALQCFHRALEIAGQQHARSLALRAATSLTRASRSPEQRQAARDRLATIYGCFREGLDTHDLVEARSLLSWLDGKASASAGGGHT